MKSFACIFAVAMAFTMSLTAADLSVTLRVTPTTSVLGIPPSISVDIANLSADTIALPQEVALLVTPPDGSEPFFAITMLEGRIAVADPLWNEAGDLLPGTHATLEFPVDLSLTHPVFFGDARLRKPGRYRLQAAVISGQIQPGDFLAASPAPLIGELQAKGFLSRPATFTFTEPQGEDAEVCALVAERFHDPGCRVDAIDVHYDLIREIRTRFPHSSFMPYLLGRAPCETLDERMALYESAIAGAGSSPAANWYRWLLADLHVEAAFNYNTPRATRRQHLSTARKLWNDLGHSSNAALRRAAAAKLRDESIEATSEGPDQSD